jgi:hypothetical protein
MIQYKINPVRHGSNIKLIQGWKNQAGPEILMDNCPLSQ